MRGVDFILEDGQRLHVDTDGHAGVVRLLQHGQKQFLTQHHRLFHGRGRLKYALLSLFRHVHAQPLDERHGLSAATRGEREDDLAKVHRK